MKYRKKPIVIEAIQFNGKNFSEISRFVGEKLVCEQEGNLAIFPKIKTLESEMIASPNDWIIKGVKGEFYPCKSDIFEATYEKVEEPPL
jgi:hypothetical protein